MNKKVTLNVLTQLNYEVRDFTLHRSSLYLLSSKSTDVDYVYVVFLLFVYISTLSIMGSSELINIDAFSG